MQVSRVINGLALVGDLKAALTHAKVHSVHVDEAWVRLFVSCLRQVGECVLVDWNSDVNFGPSSLSDGLDKSSKSWMQIDCLINDKSALGCLIDLREVSLVVFYQFSEFYIFKLDVVFSPQRFIFGRLTI